MGGRGSEGRGSGAREVGDTGGDRCGFRTVAAGGHERGMPK